MAKLSSHGSKLLQLEFVNKRKAYMSDGHILINQGNGWKLYKKFKPGVDISAAIEKVIASRRASDSACPNWAEYRAMVCKLVSLEHRYFLHHGIEILGNDVDGLKVELEDQYPHISLDLDDVSKLCFLYQVGSEEVRQYRAEKEKEKTNANP